MKYLRLFDDKQNYSNDIGDNVRIDVPNVSLVLNSESVFFNSDTVREAYFNVTDESDMTLINDYRMFSEIYLNGSTNNSLPKLVEGSFTIDANDLELVDEITWHNKNPKKFNSTYANSFVVSCNEEILDDYYVGFSMFAGGSSGGILLHDISLFGTLNELFYTQAEKETARINSNTIDLSFFLNGLTNFVTNFSAVIFKPNENGEFIPLTTKNSYVANIIEEKTYDISETQILDDFLLLDFTLKCEQDILPTDILFRYENNEIVPLCTIEEFLAESKDELYVDLIDSKTIGTTHGYYPMFNYFTLFGIMRGEVILTQEVNIVGINGFELDNYSLSTDKLGENKIEFKITNRFTTPMFYNSTNLTKLNDKALKYNKIILPVAFQHCENLTSITIPNSVTSIGDEAFWGCYNLRGAKIGNGVTTIGRYAFSNCSSLTSVTIPNSVTTIGDDAFYYCTNLRSANIPNRLTTIKSGTFSNCVNLSGITIPDSVTSIESHAFANCDKLDKLVIPKNVKNIESSAFYGCKFQRDKFINHTGLTDSLNWGAMLYDTIQPDGLCLDENIAKSCHKWATNVVIPSYVTDISYSAFAGCLNLKTVSIPNSVVSIGSTAFDSCTNLIEITIPDGVTAIENNTFSRCTNLTSVNIPNSITTIGNSAFSTCESLTNVTIPNSVTTIGNYAFSGCDSFTSVNIPNSVTTIGNYAFYNCDNLASITIGNGVTTIGENLLTGCKQLEYITVAELNPKYDSRNNCNGLIETATNTLIAGCKNTVIPSGVTKIGKYAFLDSTISTCVIPEGVTHIGIGAFEECGSLESITMPTTLTRIEYDCFYECGLKTITCLAKTAPSLGVDSLDVDTRNGVLRVPTGSNYSSWLNALPSGWTIEYI